MSNPKSIGAKLFARIESDFIYANHQPEKCFVSFSAIILNLKMVLRRHRNYVVRSYLRFYLHVSVWLIPRNFFKNIWLFYFFYFPKKLSKWYFLWASERYLFQICSSRCGHLLWINHWGRLGRVGVGVRAIGTRRILIPWQLWIHHVLLRLLFFL